MREQMMAKTTRTRATTKTTKAKARAEPTAKKKKVTKAKPTAKRAKPTRRASDATNVAVALRRALGALASVRARVRAHERDPAGFVDASEDLFSVAAHVFAAQGPSDAASSLLDEHATAVVSMLEREHGAAAFEPRFAELVAAAVAFGSPAVHGRLTQLPEFLLDPDIESPAYGRIPRLFLSMLRGERVTKTCRAALAERVRKPPPAVYVAERKQLCLGLIAIEAGDAAALDRCLETLAGLQPQLCKAWFRPKADALLPRAPLALVRLAVERGVALQVDAPTHSRALVERARRSASHRLLDAAEIARLRGATPDELDAVRRALDALESETPTKPTKRRRKGKVDWSALVQQLYGAAVDALQRLEPETSVVDLFREHAERVVPLLARSEWLSERHVAALLGSATAFGSAEVLRALARLDCGRLDTADPITSPSRAVLALLAGESVEERCREALVVIRRDEPSAWRDEAEHLWLALAALEAGDEGALARALESLDATFRVLRELEHEPIEDAALARRHLAVVRLALDRGMRVRFTSPHYPVGLIDRARARSEPAPARARS